MKRGEERRAFPQADRSLGRGWSRKESQRRSIDFPRVLVIQVQMPIAFELHSRENKELCVPYSSFSSFGSIKNIDFWVYLLRFSL